MNDVRSSVASLRAWLLVGLLLAGLGTGCSESKSTASSTIDPRLQELGSEDNRLLYLAEETLVGRCMERAGFEFVVAAPQVEDIDEHPYGNDDVETRRRNGYGSRQPGTTADPNLPYTESLTPARQRRFQEALLGGKGSKSGEVALADGNTITFGLEGCAAEARGGLYGNAKRYSILLGFVENLATEIQNRVVEDEAYIGALDRWADCMDERGFPYRRPGDASAAAGELPRDKEIKIAVTDATCARQTRLVATGERLERIHRAGVYAENEGRILGYREMQRNAIDKAKRIVAQG